MRCPAFAAPRATGLCTLGAVIVGKTRLVLVALGPILVLSQAAERVSPRLRAAALWSALVATAGGLAALYVVVRWGNPGWNLLTFRLLATIHLVVGTVEVAVATRMLGGGWRRALGAAGGAVIGHALWCLGWLALNPIGDPSEHVALVILTVIVPTAVLGSCSAATGAALAGRPPGR